MKKTFLAILLSFSVMIGSVAHIKIALATFKDVPATHPNYDAITYVQTQAIVNGYEDGTFKPDQPINRAEFLKIIVLAVVGQEPLEHAGKCFSDVETGMWFYSYVCYAQRVGIVGGYPDGSFKAGQNISFVEAAKIMVNAYQYLVGADNVWFKPFVEKLAEKKAIPVSISSFTQQITRGEMAEIVYRLHAKVSNKPSRSYSELEHPLSSSTGIYSNVEKGFSANFMDGYSAYDSGVDFGPIAELPEAPNHETGFSYTLTFTAALSAQAVMDKLDADEIYVDSEIVEINGLTVVKYEDLGLCAYPTYVVIGRKYNYTLQPRCGDGEENFEYMKKVIQTFKFID